MCILTDVCVLFVCLFVYLRVAFYLLTYNAARAIISEIKMNIYKSLAYLGVTVRLERFFYTEHGALR